jgi:ribosome-binding protein aMBF1 (putative translation factor)
MVVGQVDDSYFRRNPPQNKERRGLIASAQSAYQRGCDRQSYFGIIPVWDQKWSVAKAPTQKSLYSSEYERFLRMLRQARDSAGLTQSEAARELQRPQSFISKCESGERRVDVVELTQFCRVYGVTTSAFLKKLN